MKAVYCPCCGGRTKRNDGTSSGSQRWRCTACGASTTPRYDNAVDESTNKILKAELVYRETLGTTREPRA